jgi:hypothetical protein
VCVRFRRGSLRHLRFSCNLHLSFLKSDLLTNVHDMLATHKVESRRILRAGHVTRKLDGLITFSAMLSNGARAEDVA